MEENNYKCHECEEEVLEGFGNWTFCEKCNEPVHEKCIDYKEGYATLCSDCKL